MGNYSLQILWTLCLSAQYILKKLTLFNTITCIATLGCIFLKYLLFIFKLIILWRISKSICFHVNFCKNKALKFLWRYFMTFLLQMKLNKIWYVPDPDICKRRILNLDLPGIPDHYTDTEKTLYFSSLISFDNITTVCQVFNWWVINY